MLPRGKVRTLASWKDASVSAEVIRTAGTSVLVEETSSDQDQGAFNRYLTRIEVRHNRALTLSSYGCNIIEMPCHSGTESGPAGVAPSGAGAVELTDLETGVTTLQAFNLAGTFTKLADGKVDALRVTSKAITWIQNGVAHTSSVPS